MECANDQAVHASNRKLKAIQTVTAQTNASAPKANARFNGRGNINRKSVKKDTFI
jgi:hypothetical protein